MTTYTVFMHYYNDAIGKSVSNTTKCQWYSALTTGQKYFGDASEVILQNGKPVMEDVTDQYGNPVKETITEPVLKADGTPQLVAVTDSNNQPILDKNGDIVYRVLTTTTEVTKRQMKKQKIATKKGYDDSETYLDIDDLDEEKKKNDLETLEIIHISNKETDTEETTDDYEKYILNSLKVTNPKYDMLFIYDGLGYFHFKHEKGMDTNDDTYKAQTQLYFDKMKRVTIRPWFFHSTYHSLKAALTKAEALIDLFGKDNILIGKEVDLTQYIEIV